jgi:peroxiredoxin
MSTKKFLAGSLALVAALGLALTASAGKFNEVLSVGDAAPEWTGLAGVDDKSHALKDYEEAKVLVAIFTCNACPVAVAYEDRLIALQQEYKDKEVQFVAINCNTDEANSLAAMKKRAEEKGFNFPYLFDETQEAGRTYGASVTPQVFVLDEARKVVYTGAIDDNFEDESQVKHQYLRDALDSVLAGKAPEAGETRAKGCGIKYNPKR